MSATESEGARDALATLRIPRRDEPRKPPAWVRLAKWLLAIVVLMGIGYGGFVLAQRNGWLRSVAEFVPEAIRAAPEVRVARVVVEKGRSADALVVATGYLESRRQAKIGARAAGRIEVVNVEEGSRVTTGEVLAILEHKDMDAALAAARATLARAEAELGEQEVEIQRTKADFDRAELLRKTGANTESEHDQARFAYEGAVARRSSLNAAIRLAEARVKESEQLKENMIIRAPFDGTVISKDAEVGESILPGGMGEASGRGSVVTIADLEQFSIDEGQLKDWQDNRRGCVADRRLAEKRKWKVGDRIPIEGTLYPFDLELELCGVFDAPQYTDSVWFHWEYLDEGLKQMNSFGTGNSGTIFAKIESADAIPGVIESIDAKFASSQNPTRTQTEAAFAQMFTDMLGNIQAYIRNIGLAVVFSLSLVAANAMAMSMRERTTEVAVLKAIGFPRSRVLTMILGESCLIALIGGVLGITLGCLFLQGLHGLSSQFFPIPVLDMLGVWLLYMLLVAAGIGLVSGIVPAVRAAQLSVVDGLRRVV